MRIGLEGVVSRGLLIRVTKLPLSVLMLLSNEPVVVLRYTTTSAKGRDNYLEMEAMCLWSHRREAVACPSLAKAVGAVAFADLGRVEEGPYFMLCL